MNFSDLDFSTLHDIPPLQHYYDTPRLSINEKGFVSMNSAFRRKAGEQREFRGKISSDGRFLVLYPMEPPNIRFSHQDGRVKHTALARQLEEEEIMLPAVYTIIWNQEQQAWVGCCQELSQPPALSLLARSKKRPAARRDA